MKETMDKVLDFLQKDRSVKKEKIMYRPDKRRSLMGFIFSLVFFVIMFMFCIVSFSLGFIILLAVSVGLLIFYGANTFTREGLFIPKYVDKRILDKYEDELIEKEELEKELEEEETERKEQD